MSFNSWLKERNMKSLMNDPEFKRDVENALREALPSRVLLELMNNYQSLWEKVAQKEAKIRIDVSFGKDYVFVTPMDSKEPTNLRDYGTLFTLDGKQVYAHKDLTW